MVYEKIKSILSEQFSVKEDDINMETELINDLDADSLDIVDLLSTIEDEFEIEVEDNEIENIKTVGDIVEFIRDIKNID